MAEDKDRNFLSISLIGDKYNWVPRYTVAPSIDLKSDYVRAQPQAGRTLRQNWRPVTGKVGPSLRNGESRTDLQHRGHR